MTVKAMSSSSLGNLCVGERDKALIVQSREAVNVALENGWIGVQDLLREPDCKSIRGMRIYDILHRRYPTWEDNQIAEVLVDFGVADWRRAKVRQLSPRQCMRLTMLCDQYDLIMARRDAARTAAIALPVTK
jgi:hypothetical protein